VKEEERSKGSVKERSNGTARATRSYANGQKVEHRCRRWNERHLECDVTVHTGDERKCKAANCEYLMPLLESLKPYVSIYRIEHETEILQIV
jgi:hypothetical protein